MAFEVKMNPRMSDIRKLEKLSNELNLEDFKTISGRLSGLKNIEYGFI